MKTRILSIILILLLCLTAGCGKVSQESEKPDGISSSESKTEESSVTEFSEEGEQSSAPTAEQQRVEATDSTTTEGTESDTQAKTVSVQPQSSTTPPQASEPQQKSDESVSRSKTPSNPVPQQPVVEKRLSRPNSRRKIPQNRLLTLATGSALHRAMPRAWDLRWTAEPFTAGTTP